MRNFNFNGNPILTAEEFTNLISTDKGLRIARFSLGYQTTSKTAAGYYVHWPSWDNVRDITDEQRETARQRYEQRREEVRQEQAQPGTVFIVTMGGDYAPTIPGGIGNHRVRVQFIDKRGDLRGVEFCPFWSKAGSPDESKGFTFDRWNKSEDERKSAHYSKEWARLEKKYKGRIIPHDKRPDFPMTYADRGTVDDLPFTAAGVLAWFEREHGLKFKRVYIDRYFFSCDEITSTTRKPRKK